MKKILKIQDNSDAIFDYFTIYKNSTILRKKGNLEFHLTLEEFTKLISSPCYYCNSEPYHNHHYKGKIYKHGGIDRICASGNYTTENCVPCCKCCNGGKKSLDLVDFCAWVVRVYNFNHTNLEEN
jgi:hypothetical protein